MRTTRATSSTPRPSAGIPRTGPPARGFRTTPPPSRPPLSGGSATLIVRRSEPAEHLFRRLLGAYLGGAREFALRERPGVSSATREVVRSFCRRTRQPEVISDEPAVLRLRDLAYESPIPLVQRLGRMGRIVVEFHREAVDGWSDLPLDPDGAWERRDDEIDREAWYIQRLAAIRIGEGMDGALVLGPWTIARSLERIADHAATLGEEGRRLVDLPQGTGPLMSLKQFHRQAMDHLEGVLAATDVAQANELLDMGEALLVSGRSLSDRLLPTLNGSTMPPATSAAIARILESIARTIAYAQDIAQVVLDRSLPTESPPEFPVARTASSPSAS